MDDRGTGHGLTLLNRAGRTFTDVIISPGKSPIKERPSRFLNILHIMEEAVDRNLNFDQKKSRGAILLPPCESLY